MIYRFKFISDEVEGFSLTVEADASCTFLDLHKLILQAAGYPDDQMTSFFICNDDWEKLQEVTLVEMDAASDYDNMVMEDTALEDLLGDEGQKLLYVFDPMFERGFFGQLTDIITGRSLDRPELVKKTGRAPKQLQQEDDIEKIVKEATSGSMDEDFFGSDGFNDDELDDESFGMGTPEELDQF